MGQNLDELFDVVDEHDRVTGQATRRAVHANGWRHRAVHVLVFDRAGHVFLHKRSQSKDLFPGLWDSSCAGHVGAGEDYDGTARRELEEELGLRPAQDPVQILQLPAQPMTGWEFVRVYRLEHDGPFRLDPDEIECGAWFAPTDVDRWLAERPDEVAPALRLIWSALSDGSGPRPLG